MRAQERRLPIVSDDGSGDIHRIRPEIGKREEADSPRHDDGSAVFNPGVARLPTPRTLAEYAAIDPDYPQRLIASFQIELGRNFRYQLFALAAGWTFALSLSVEAGILALHGHEKMALALIGANAVGLATRMLTKAATRE